ncbi:hypothetical protein [Clostridium perfringens]|uniref:hypothetical protein n=1 Tax=Clostridium perfringens TaxID=1502 RepID=UPI001FB96D64|nr:hypothetical protein [Clostridium perfringens]
MVKDGLRGSGIGESLLNFLEGYLKKEKNSKFLLSSSMTDATKLKNGISEEDLKSVDLLLQ